MGVSIIGAGAIGMLFAAYVTKAGHHVTLYTRTNNQADMLNKHGLTLYAGDRASRFHVKACPLTNETVFHDPYIVVAVKQHHLKAIFSVIQKNQQNCVYLFVQNGMGHLSLIETLQDCHLFIGVVEHGAIKQSDTEVRHTGFGTVKIASFQQPIHEMHQSFISSWQQEDFPIEFWSNWYPMLANKLVVNAVINPLTALFGVKNGELLSNSYFFGLMKGLYQETVSVLEIRDKGLWEHVQSVCLKTANNESSMLRDMKLKRKSEIDAINGYILKLANEQGKQLPYMTFVFNSIKGLEWVNEKAGD